MDFNKIGLAATKTDDLTVDVEFERELPVEGTALLRLLGYVELGRHDANNPKYKPSLNCVLTFELNHPKHMIEIDDKKVPQLIKVYVSKFGGAKSNYKKLFNLMNAAYGNKYTQFIQMVGNAYIGKVTHNTSEDGKKTYANLQDKKTGFTFLPPVMVDPITEEKKVVPVPECHNEPYAFLWNNESVTDDMIKEMWESIYIDGTYEKDGKDVSKNWMQETIMANHEWEGSATQALTQEHVDIDAPTEEVSVDESEDKEPEEFDLANLPSL